MNMTFEELAGLPESSEEIKRIAMTELGMKYPDQSQVVNISGESDDYVRQYGKIPEK